MPDTCQKHWISSYEECKNGCINHLRGLLKAFQAIDHSIALIETAILIFCIGTLIIAEVFTAVYREIFGTNFGWVEQFLKYMVIWVGLLGGSLATQTREHISIEVISKFVTPRIGWFAMLLVNFFAATVTLLLAIGAYNYVLDDRREYLISGGQSSYFPFESIGIYACPEASNQQRRYMEESNLKSLGYTSSLLKLLESPAPERRDIEHTHKMLTSELENRTKFGLWKREWFLTQWQNRWNVDFEKDWNEKGMRLWNESGISRIDSTDKAEWQAEWLTQIWATKGITEWEKVWQDDGIKAWKAQEAETDLNQDEFREDWKYNWIKKRWNEEWKNEWEQSWQNGGSLQCFQRAWKKNWIAQRWETQWKTDWETIQNEHFRKFSNPGKCPYCGNELVREPYKIPRWLLLILIPISLFVISWRFFLAFFDGVLNPVVRAA